jgi:AcrR family transcriptional regulator
MARSNRRLRGRICILAGILGRRFPLSLKRYSDRVNLLFGAKVFYSGPMQVDQLKLKITETVFNLEAQRGHLKWSVTQVARASKISRSLVYYHFGNTKKDILANCVESLALEFYGLKDPPPGEPRLTLAESLEKSHKLYLQIHSFAVFCQKWRHRPSVFRDKFLEILEIYDRRMEKYFPLATPEQRHAMRALFYGLVVAPEFDSALLPAALKLLKLDELVAKKPKTRGGSA